MKEVIALILPPATALAGMRMSRLILGAAFQKQFGLGLKFGLGLAVGMLVFSQALLLCALAGLNGSGFLACLAILWGIAEAILIAMKFPATAPNAVKFRTGHLWLLLLLPLLYSWWVFGRLSTLEGTMEFDANAFWVFKAKIIYLEQGKDLVNVLHQPTLAYAHMDYPLLVPCLYTLDYGAAGGVDEFVNKVWPFWMMVALCAGILSEAGTWRTPRLLPIAVVTLIGFLPASLEFIRNEGGTMPMVFYVSLAALLMVRAICNRDESAHATLMLILAGCFSTKWEGAVFAAVSLCALLPFCLRQGWLRHKIFWRSLAVAAICLLPYVVFRLCKPVPHPESSWMRDGLAAPLTILHRFPQIWFLNIFARFFSAQFFNWKAVDDHLQWIGQWDGRSSFQNEDLSILPWLLLTLLVFSAIYNPRGRVALGVLSAAMISVLTILSFVVACLPRMQADLSNGIWFASNIVGRYYYPFFLAWFVGTVAVWFAGHNRTEV